MYFINHFVIANDSALQGDAPSKGFLEIQVSKP